MTHLHLRASLLLAFALGPVTSGCSDDFVDEDSDASLADVFADAAPLTDATTFADASERDAEVSDLGGLDANGPIDLGPSRDAEVQDLGSDETVPADMRGLLDLMNAARAVTGSAPLRWNAGVAATAADWAEGCTWMHAPANQRIYMGTQMGENLSAGSGTSWTPAALGQGWVDERADYDCATNTCAPNQVCGHYTQVIWRNSTEVGCALRVCATGSPLGNGTWQFLVCRYLPAGNYNNQRPIPVGDCP